MSASGFPPFDSAHRTALRYRFLPEWPLSTGVLPDVHRICEKKESFRKQTLHGCEKSVLKAHYRKSLAKPTARGSKHSCVNFGLPFCLPIFVQKSVSENVVDKVSASETVFGRESLFDGDSRRLRRVSSVCVWLFLSAHHQLVYPFLSLSRTVSLARLAWLG